ncbi:hypothetical protein CRENBAI_016842 [Crenichthys baileyi]|uniref:Uncharacterized protein n=1 Tax=Crenichthys baileyi TaxID=28760 RepID=A0AAV9SAX6_9TELE
MTSRIHGGAAVQAVDCWTRFSCLHGGGAVTRLHHQSFPGIQKAALARRHSRVPVFVCVKWRPYITTAVGNTKKPSRPSHAGRGKERSARLRKPPLKAVILRSTAAPPLLLLGEPRLGKVDLKDITTCDGHQPDQRVFTSLLLSSPYLESKMANQTPCPEYRKTLRVTEPEGRMSFFSGISETLCHQLELEGEDFNPQSDGQTERAPKGGVETQTSATLCESDATKWSLKFTLG